MRLAYTLSLTIFVCSLLLTKNLLGQVAQLPCANTTFEHCLNIESECIAIENSHFNCEDSQTISARHSIEINPNSTLTPNESGVITLEIRGGEVLEAAWFEPSTVGEVGRYEKLEIGLKLPDEVNSLIQQFKINGEGGLNPFDPDQLDVFGSCEFLSENGWEYTKPIFGFYYENHERRWDNPDYGAWTWEQVEEEYNFRIRLAPEQLGLHRIRLYMEANGESLSTGEIYFNCVGSDNLGYVYSKSTSHYFNLGEDMFFPVGQNATADIYTGNRYPESCNFVNNCDGNPIGEVQNSSPWGLTLYTRPKAHPAFFNNVNQAIAQLADNGANYFRLINFGQGFQVETTKLTDFFDSMHSSNELDFLMDHAKELGLKFSWSILGQYELNKNPYNFVYWDWEQQEDFAIWGDVDNPYKSAFNLVEPTDFFASEEAKYAYKKRLRYLIARWGYSTEIAMIELCSEVNGVHGPDHMADGTNSDANSSRSYVNSGVIQSEIQNWQMEMSQYIKNQLGDDHHLISTSYLTDGPISNLLACRGDDPSPSGIQDLSYFTATIDANSFSHYRAETLYDPWKNLTFFVKCTQGYHVFHSVVHGGFQSTALGDNHSFVNDGIPPIERMGTYHDYYHNETVKSSFVRNKPLIISETGSGDLFACGRGIFDTKNILISPFTGLSGMGLSYDLMLSPQRQDVYSLYGEMNNLLHQHDFSSLFWEPHFKTKRVFDYDINDQIILSQGIDPFDEDFSIFDDDVIDYMEAFEVEDFDLNAYYLELKYDFTNVTSPLHSKVLFMVGAIENSSWHEFNSGSCDDFYSGEFTFDGCPEPETNECLCASESQRELLRLTKNCRHNVKINDLIEKLIDEEFAPTRADNLVIEIINPFTGTSQQFGSFSDVLPRIGCGGDLPPLYLFRIYDEAFDDLIKSDKENDYKFDSEELAQIVELIERGNKIKQESAQLKLLLYPSPSSDYITIKIPGYTNDRISLEIIDYTGKTMVDQFQYELGSLINITQLQSGVYYARANLKNGKELYDRVVIVH